MKRNLFKNIILGSALLVSAMGVAACSGGGSKEAVNEEPFNVTYDQIKLGEDYTDVKADLKFLTHRTDIMDTDFKRYIEEFQKLYPNVNIEYEGLTDYANDVTTRLSTGDWGDICMIPTTVSKNELSNYFVNMGDFDTLSKSYTSLDNFKYENSVYGFPSMVNIQGIVYNKAVFEKAGVNEIPKTPDEFIEALKKIKDNTDAIPLYTNFAADWTMNAWDAYIDRNATGDPKFSHYGRVKGLNPYADRGDGTGPFAVYDTLFEAVKGGLTEDDPTTTDWEGSKGMLNRGEIGCMVLGSWSLPQIKGAGEETLMNDINNESELGVNVSGNIPKEVLEAAIDGSKTMEEMSNEWNEKWTAAQKKFGVTPQEYTYQPE